MSSLIVFEILGLFQIIVGVVFPILLIIILWLAWRDFHRWVEHQIDKAGPGDKLDEEVQEFIE